MRESLWEFTEQSGHQHPPKDVDGKFQAEICSQIGTETTFPL